MATFLVFCCLVGSLVGQEEVVMPNVPDEMPDNGPTIRVQIPTELKEKGRQYNQLEMAKRIAAARQANKEAARIEGRQLSWESLALPKEVVLESDTGNSVGSDESVSYENQDQMDDVLPDIKRYIHVDVSAMPPKSSYLIEVIDIIAENGASGIFLEYGNRFPFKDNLSRLSSDVFKYTEADIQLFDNHAREKKIELLPVFDVCTNAGFVATKFESVRIRDNLIEDFSPFKPDAKTMIKSILNQLISFHSEAGTIHLGCSKFKSFATGSLKGLLHERNTTAELAYLDHVQDIGSFIKESFPKIRPIVWDDTLNKIKVEVLMNHKMPDYADIAIQAQLNDVSLDARKILKQLQKYGKIFDNLWVTSAYKSVKDLALPDLKKHAQQTEEMVYAIKSAPAYSNVVGIALKGPSQMNYFTAPSAILPAAIPSMITTFMTSMRGKFSTSVLWESSRKLGFQTKIPVVYQPRPQEVIPGHYAGSEIWRWIQTLENTRAEVTSFLLGPNYNAYFNKYLIKTQRVSFYRLETIQQTLSKLVVDLSTTKEKLLFEMSKMFDESILSPWTIHSILQIEEMLENANVAVNEHLQTMQNKESKL